MIRLNWFKSNTMIYEARSLAVGSALWAKTGTETVKERGDWLAAEQQKKREKTDYYDDYLITFLLYRSTVGCNPGCDLGKPRKLSVASVATGKKQNTTVQLRHFIVNRHPLLFFFFKSFRTLSSIHYNTHSFLILREALTRGALEVPWWFTPNGPSEPVKNSSSSPKSTFSHLSRKPSQLPVPVIPAMSSYWYVPARILRHTTKPSFFIT